YVVAVGLHVGDVAAVHEPGDTAELDRDLLVEVGCRGGRPLHHPTDRLGQPGLAHRLEHVVDRREFDGPDRVLLVGGDDAGGRGLRETGQHGRPLEPVADGHREVEEDRVDLVLAQRPQRVGRRAARQHRRDAWVAAQEEGELVEGWSLVVDDQDPEADRLVHGWTPGANFGTRTITFVPAPGAVSTTRP